MRRDRLIGVFIVLLGFGYVAAALAINVPITYAAVGPRAIPIGIGLGIVLSGVWLAALPGPIPAPDSEQRIALDWPLVGWMIALLLGYAVVLPIIGFVLTNIVFLLLCAQVLGERHHLLRDTIVAVLFALGTYVLFSYLLRIDLPSGPVESLLDAGLGRLRP